MVTYNEAPKKEKSEMLRGEGDEVKFDDMEEGTSTLVSLDIHRRK